VLNPIVRSFHGTASRLAILFSRKQLFLSTSVAGGIAEVHGQEDLD
jgi:hypothetical protein